MVTSSPQQNNEGGTALEKAGPIGGAIAKGLGKLLPSATKHPKAPIVALAILAIAGPLAALHLSRGLPANASVFAAEGAAILIIVVTLLTIKPGWIQNALQIIVLLAVAGGFVIGLGALAAFAGLIAGPFGNDTGSGGATNTGGAESKQSIVAESGGGGSTGDPLTNITTGGAAADPKPTGSVLTARPPNTGAVPTSNPGAAPSACKQRLAEIFPQLNQGQTKVKSISVSGGVLTCSPEPCPSFPPNLPATACTYP